MGIMSCKQPLSPQGVKCVLNCRGGRFGGIPLSPELRPQVKTRPLNPIYPFVFMVFFVKYFSLKKASEFPFFSKGFSLPSAGIMHPCA